MDFSTMNLTQFGISIIFIAWSWKLYNDSRSDSTKREDKLMEHLDKQAETMKEISETLQNLDNRMCAVEERIKGRRRI